MAVPRGLGEQCVSSSVADAHISTSSKARLLRLAACVKRLALLIIRSYASEMVHGHHRLPCESEPPPWLSWLERRSHNPEVASSILAGGNTLRRLIFAPFSLISNFGL